MKIFHIIAHTHWDREWYKTYQENRVRLIPFMDDLMETLKDPDYSSFMLDGQTSLLDDYLEVKPDKKDELKAAVQAGKMIVGPWFVQPDEHIPSGESLIRNLLIADKRAREFGQPMKVGYLPDSFGQSAAMPTLLSGFGIQHAIFYRGLTAEDHTKNTFLWKGLDDSKVNAEWLQYGYGNAMFLSEDLAESVKEIEQIIQANEGRTTGGQYLLMSGSDQCFAKKFLPSLCTRLEAYYKEQGKDYRFVISSVEAYMDAVAEHREAFATLTGEFRHGKHSRVHNSIGSSRMDIKKDNYQVETKYQYLLEPLSVFNELITGQADRDMIRRGWRYIVENHAHDSICTCSTDAVHREMKLRMEAADQIADTLIEKYKGNLMEHVNFDERKGRPVLVFSPHLSERDDYVSAEVYVKDETFALMDAQGETIPYEIIRSEKINLKDRKVSFKPLPDDLYSKMTIEFFVKTDGLGYATYYISEGQKPAQHKLQIASDHSLENAYLLAAVETDGTLTITDKVTGQVYKRQHIFKDGGNAGDEYDYSPPHEDLVIDSVGKLQSVSIIRNSTFAGSLRLTFELEVPETTGNDKRSEHRKPLSIQTDITLYASGDYLDFKTTIENDIENHRLQVAFSSDQQLTHHMADMQLGELERENVFKRTQESVKDGWSERYYPIFPQHKYVALTDEENKGFAIANRGILQYQVEQTPATEVNLTVLSAVGYMGNENLKYRPGRRSGALCKTPDAQMFGVQKCEYRWLPVRGNGDYRDKAVRYTVPVLAVMDPDYSYDGLWSDRMNLVKASEKLRLGALKLGELDEGIILRVNQPGRDLIQEESLWFNRNLVQSIGMVNLAERDIQDNEVKIGISNTPDGSEKARLSGEIEIKNMKPNALKSFKMKP